MLDSRPFDVVATLAPVRRRLGLERVGRYTFRGVGVGAAVGVLILILTHAWAVSLPLQASVVAVVAGGLLGAAIGLSHWPDSLEAARVVDRHFGLKDRLTTALDYRSSQDPLPVLQRVDVARRLQGLTVSESGRGELRWRPAALSVLTILILVALLFLGGPQTSRAVMSASNGEGRRIHSVAAVRVPEVVRRLEQGLTPQERQDPALHKLEQTLARLRRQLLRTPDRAAALRAISLAQQQLHRLAASLHPMNPQQAAQLNRSLSQYMAPQQRTSSASSDQKALSAAAQMLSRLAKSLSHLSAPQRAQLARALAQAASQSSDSQLRASLSRAASSLAGNNTQSAARTLQGAASALSQAARAQAAQSHLNKADNQLDSLKNEVSGLNSAASSNQASGREAGGSGQSGNSAAAFRRGEPGSGGRAPGQSGLARGNSSGAGSRSANGQGGGKGQGSGSGRGSGLGKGYGQSSGQSGSSSRGNALSAGHGTGGGSGRGGVGNRGAGGGRGGAGRTGRARFVTVYIPGKHGRGPSTIQSGPNGTPTHSTLVPYQLVVGQYSQSAHTALDRSDLPPDLRTYVRDYFASVSH